ncbi:SAM-dependent methyltransferase [Salinibacter ruber]|uniref:class I SAM-dependent methyltransferase n=1 Tax=Salinibacter ruber TaxID=146919 RepID=UPI002169058B|nr:class I SAM-dependent methyltransferase [Salinibacter ruber]MCS3828227.1 SAM-dependent methyltransferase [Salinibacter ruber]MCS4055655.1 SAM-dependent methyltransferase [Salinibacter ruber]MCS4059026.1 SAM-dependent methyltransferase [Salinibacter ruber]MCS4159828.1 SAM-dependent methyltransferase [Salinibacter ruber]
MPDAVLTDEERAQQDDRPDRAFYREPRLVQHVDEQFRERLTDLYRRQLGAGDDVLDLMSSWVSHLPDDLDLGRVAGHGMNEEELAANERLTECFVQDLNETQGLPLETGAFDAALCAVSVQYLRHPEQVFAEVARVLRPGGIFVVSFSNRMFAQKAIRAWRTASGPGRLQLVKQYFEAVEAFRDPTTISENPFVPPTRRFLGGAPDPFYAAHARTQD